MQNTQTQMPKHQKFKQTLATRKQGPSTSINIIEVGRRGTKKTLRKGIDSFRREAHESSFNPDS